MKSRSFFRNIVRNLWGYLIILAVSIALGISFVTIVDKPRKEATITLFVGSYTTNVERVKEELMNKKPDYLREINLHCFSPTSKNYTYAYRSIGLKGADIIVLPSSKIDNQTISDFYAVISDEYLDKYFSSNKTLEIDSKAYGVKIHEKGQPNGELLSFFDEESHDEDYYVFYKRNSLHIGDITSSKYETAFMLSQVLK